MNKCVKVAALYIATLRAISIVHKNNHWITNGSNFYGSHLLFERLYESAIENLDLAAEKFIGLFGDECLSYDMQNDLLNKILVKYKNFEGSPFNQSLAIEKDFLNLSKEAYNCFSAENNLSLGLDDCIMSIASDREEACYLLQQSKDKN